MFDCATRVLRRLAGEVAHMPTLPPGYFMSVRILFVDGTPNQYQPNGDFRESTAS